jgi:hypothetical protein
MVYLKKANTPSNHIFIMEKEIEARSWPRDMGDLIETPGWRF